MTSQPEPSRQRPAEPAGMTYETYADPAAAGAASQPVWEQPPFPQTSSAQAPFAARPFDQAPFAGGPFADAPFAQAPVTPANEVLSGDVVTQGQRPRPSAGLEWLLFLRRWGIPIAVILGIVVHWWFFMFIVILAVLPRIVADIPRRSVNQADARAAMRAHRNGLRVARQQYRISVRQVRVQRRSRRY